MPSPRCRAQNPITCKYHGVQLRVDEPRAAAPIPAAALMPAHIVKTGIEIGHLFRFATALKGGYDPARHTPPRNLANDSTMWTKPTGGLWLSTVNAENVSTWTELWGGASPDAAAERAVAFNPDARVLVIDSLADYHAILDRYPHQPQFPTGMRQFATSMGNLLSGGMSAVNADGTSKRGMDFEKLADDYDGIVLTQRGLYTCGRQSFQEHMGKDLSLYLWDIECAFVLNRNAITVT